MPRVSRWSAPPGLARFGNDRLDRTCRCCEPTKRSRGTKDAPSADHGTLSSPPLADTEQDARSNVLAPDRGPLARARSMHGSRAGRRVRAHAGGDRAAAGAEELVD